MPFHLFKILIKKERKIDWVAENSAENLRKGCLGPQRFSFSHFPLNSSQYISTTSAVSPVYEAWGACLTIDISYIVPTVLYIRVYVADK